jgi:hypothetical protein
MIGASSERSSNTNTKNTKIKINGNHFVTHESKTDGNVCRNEAFADAAFTATDGPDLFIAISAMRFFHHNFFLWLNYMNLVVGLERLNLL